MAAQFQSVQQQAQGFNNLLTAGGPNVKTFTGTMQQLTGTADALQFMLQAGGKHAGEFQTNVDAVSRSGQRAGGNIQNWALVQKNLNLQLKNDADRLGKLGIQIGTDLIPWFDKASKEAEKFGNWLGKNKTDAEILGGVIVGILGLAMLSYIGKLTHISGLMKGIFKADQWIGKKVLGQGTAPTGPGGAGASGDTFLSAVEKAGQQFIAAAERAGEVLTSGGSKAGTEMATGGETAGADVSAGGTTAATEIEAGGTTAATEIEAGGTTAATEIEAGGGIMSKGVSGIFGPALAAVVGYQIGTYLNKTFGISKKVSNWATNKLYGPANTPVNQALAKVTGKKFKDETAAQQLATEKQLLAAVLHNQGKYEADTSAGGGASGAEQIGTLLATIETMIARNPANAGSKGKYSRNIKGVPKFGTGATITGATLGVMGDGGTEYVIPASMLGGASPASGGHAGALPPGLIGGTSTIYQIENLVIVAQNPAQMEQQLAQRARVSALSSKPTGPNLGVGT